jgi:hypothetical protein
VEPERTGSESGGRGARRILYYHDPMHPAYKSDKPGIAPDCGMQLEPVYADEAGAATGPADGSMAPPGTVRISAEKQQLIGVRVEEVRPGRPGGDRADAGPRGRRRGAPLQGEFRGGRPDSRSQRRHHGQPGEKEEVLASYFTNDSVTFRNQQNYLNLLNVKGDVALADFARDTLKLAGLSDAQVEEMARTKKLDSTYRITSPVAGIVLARNVSAGQRFDKGFEFYRIADLTSVWVVANVFENDARLLRSAGGATVRYLGRAFPTRMSGVLPEFDPTRARSRSGWRWRTPTTRCAPTCSWTSSSRSSCVRHTGAGERGAGYRTAQGRVCRPRQRFLRTAQGRDGCAVGRQRHDHGWSHARREDRGLRQFPDRFREPAATRGDSGRRQGSGLRHASGHLETRAAPGHHNGTTYTLLLGILQG